MAQEVDRPWPLQVDVEGRRHEVTLHPGQMLLYEGATCPHGRIDPLDGDAFVNLFVHYRPAEWPWDEPALIDAGRSAALIDADGRLPAL